MDIIGVGSPAILKLENFGAWLWKAFDTPAYLVGSAAKGKQWRDVDIRMCLSDEAFNEMFGELGFHSPKFGLLCSAISLLGKEMTGLPIDFQFQSYHTFQSYPRTDHNRHALGVFYLLDRKVAEQE